MNLQVSILRILKGGKAFVGLKVLLFNGHVILGLNRDLV
jgi:hypothetical protein